MEALKELVATLTAVLIFISAVEIIVPQNKTKKYVSFVLGLILISVILNPIIKLITNGEKNIEDGIANYSQVFSKDSKRISSDDSINFETNGDNNETRKVAFIKNFNQNCENLLKTKYPDMTFKCDVDCDVDFNNIKIDIKKLKVGVKDKNVKSIKSIEKVQIGKDKNSKKSDSKNSGQADDDGKFDEIAGYMSSQLNVSKDKIEVYVLDE